MNSRSQASKSIAPALEFRHVTFGFDNTPVIDDVSFTLQENAMLIITGASGSGKSVLLRLAIGLLRPDEGQIFIRGRDITQMTEEEMLELRSRVLGMVFQDEALFTDRDVYGNAAYRLEEHDWSEEDVDVAVREILGFVGLESDLEKEVFELSGGMKRRLELARAIVGWPPIMLLDEPTTGLDPINAYQVRDMIIRARTLHQMSLVYVSKAMHEIKYLASHRAVRGNSGSIIVTDDRVDRQPGLSIMVLDEGKVVFEGSHRAFTESQHPAILRLLNPQPSAVNPSFRTKDPWGKKRVERESRQPESREKA